MGAQSFAERERRQVVLDSRFFSIHSSGIEASLAAVFRGGEAVETVGKIEWIDGCVHIQGAPQSSEILPSVKLYLPPENMGETAENGCLDFSGTLRLLNGILKDMGMIEALVFEWTLRIPAFMKAFCVRIPELVEFERRGIKLPVWGFGRPHVFTGRLMQKRPELAGPVRDFSPRISDFPAVAPFVSEHGWSFEPVWIGANYNNRAFGLKIESVWDGWDGPETGGIVALRGQELSFRDEGTPPLFLQAFEQTYGKALRG